MAIFYYHNIWRFPDDVDWSHLHGFLATIGPRARLQLHHIQVLMPTGGVKQWFRTQWPSRDLKVVDAPPTRLVRVPQATRYINSMNAVLDILRQSLRV